MGLDQYFVATPEHDPSYEGEAKIRSAPDVFEFRKDYRLSCFMHDHAPPVGDPEADIWAVTMGTLAKWSSLIESGEGLPHWRDVDPIPHPNYHRHRDTIRWARYMLDHGWHVYYCEG